MGSLLLTLAVGLFILFGTFITLFTKNNKKYIDFSISIAFGVIVPLLIFELVPESFELINENYYLLLLFIFVGIVLLKVIDRFIPHHNENNHTHANLKHIFLVLGITLVIHNLIEGMAIYLTASDSFSNGLLMCVGVGLHNLPLGMALASTYYENTNNKIKTVLFSTIISVSTFIGGIILHLFKSNINYNFLGYLMCITVGMLIYISIFELLPMIKNSKNKKLVIIGLAIGFISILVSHFLHVHH